MKCKKTVCLLLAAVMLLCVPFEAFSASEIQGITTSGFTVSGFSQGIDYYLCYPSSFADLKITAVKTATANPAVSISTEQYCGKTSAQRLGDTLDVGYGRAKVTLTVTSGGKTYKYLFVLTDPRQDSFYYAFPVGSTYVYKSASTSSGTIKSVSASTSNAAAFYCVGASGAWTHVQILSQASLGREGWIQTKYLSRGYISTDLPDRYFDAVTALKKAHPTWEFTYVYVGGSMSSYAATIQTQLKNDAGITKSLETIMSYMDPKNYMTEDKIYAFLDLTQYDPAHFNDTGLGAMWVEKSNAIVTKKQAVAYINEAAKSLRMNPFFIASRAAIESGYGTSKLARGEVAGSEGYYNFYGIRAVDKNPENGASYAKERNWNTPRRALIEGANWIKDQYVDRGQCTPYFLRFFPFKSTHIYMSDLTAPTSEAAKLKQGYTAAGTAGKSLHFFIPVYDEDNNGSGMFFDVSPASWYYEDVYRSVKLGLFEGIGGGLFAPEGDLTRAQFVAVLARLSGADLSSYKTTSFTDIKSGAWYFKSVAWAEKNGVIAGTSPGVFSPDRALDRQQLCTMLCRFSDAMRIELPKGSVTGFRDAADIADWAAESVGCCVAAGLVSGTGKNMFSPHLTASRAQGARVMSLYCEKYKKK